MHLGIKEAYRIKEIDGFLRNFEVEIVSVMPGEAIISVPLKENVIRVGDFMNGGAIMAFSDFVGALSVLSMNGVVNSFTISLDANFLEPIHDGPARFVAKNERTGSNLAFVSIKVFDSENRLCAKVNGIWRLVR